MERSDKADDGSKASTRERILDVALELFTEQGYDKTSLRDIATRLGVTKAALYYHFERKEDILLELHLRLHKLGRETLEQFEDLPEGEERADVWPQLLDRFIDQVVNNRELVLFHQRNHNALRVLEQDERHQAENDVLGQQLQRFLGSPAIPLADRVRMACSIGAVIGGLLGAGGMIGGPLGAGGALGEVPADELADLVRDAARDAFGAPRTAKK